jgi:hypothetical protein
VKKPSKKAKHKHIVQLYVAAISGTAFAVQFGKEMKGDGYEKKSDGYFGFGGSAGIRVSSICPAVPDAG